MADLDQQMRSEMPSAPLSGRVTAPLPESTLDPLFVVVPDWDADEGQECYWTPRSEDGSDIFPDEGDECLVHFTPDGRGWVPLWWPSGG